MNAHAPIQAEAAVNAATAEKPTGLALLRAAFPEHQISKLPKPSKKQTEELKADFKKGSRCNVCGGWHQTDVVHLDYVGHAALTDRLLDTDPEWLWEPIALSPDGLPLFDRNGGLWIKLTVCGMTRIGYGNAEGKSGGDAVKEIIGDALRNAAMRFGAALDLWHKGDLHVEEPSEPLATAEELAINHLRSCAIDKAIFKEAWEKNKAGWKGVLESEAYARVVAEMKRLGAELAKEPEPPKPEAAPVTANAFDISDDEIPF